MTARHRRTAGLGSFARMVLLRGAASAAGGAVQSPTVSRAAWRPNLTLRQATGPAAPTSPGRRNVRRAPRLRPPRRTALNVPALATPAAAVTCASTAGAQARPGSSHVAAARQRAVLWAPAGGAPAGEPVAGAGRAGTGEIVTTAVRHTVQRVLERGRRVEERTTAAELGSGPSGFPHRPARDGGWMLGPPPVAAARPPRSPAREHGHRVADGLAPGTPNPGRALDASSAPPRIDVEQLADQVVRRIDDRIIAHRERLGRI